MANTDQILLQTLVSIQSSRLQGTKADSLVLWFAQNACPSPCLVSALDKIGAQLRLVDPPLSAADMKNKQYASIINRLNKWWDFTKLEVFNLVQYKKAVFLDGDTLFVSTLDELFDMPAGTHTDAPKSPFNSGLFVLQPSKADYLTLLDIVKQGMYDLKESWGSAFNDTQYRPRAYAPFYGAETTQGLLYYFFHTIKKSYHVLPRDIYHYQGTESPEGVKLVHFNICAKPMPGVVPEECRKFHRKWQVVYNSLELDATCRR
jgi:alpha-N-acetylglucosamine transferase